MIAFFWEIASLRSELLASSQNLERKAAMTISSVAMTIILNEERAHFKILPRVDLSNSFCGRRFIFNSFLAAGIRFNITYEKPGKKNGDQEWLVLRNVLPSV